MQNTTTEEVEQNKDNTEEKVEEFPQTFSDDENSQADESDKTRFKDGQDLTFVRVRFPGNAKSFPFLIGKRNFAYGQKVMAMSDRGMTVGYINSFPYTVKFEQSMLPVKSIARSASEEDIQEQMDNLAKERRAEELCIRLIERHKLNMNLTHVEFIQFGKKAVFYFTAPERVDFRNLVKDLVADLKMRIELRQISVRDRAAAIGAIGACGLQTCCSSFLKGYGNVTIKMAKNQNLALIPSKINGVCGQIKCCIKYEDKVYSDKRKDLPQEGSFIETLNGDKGRVTKLHILIEQFEMLTETGYRRRYTANQFDPEVKLHKDWKFPEKLPHVIDETSNVIGIQKDDPLEEDHFYWNHNKDNNELEAKSKNDDDFQDESEQSDEDELTDKNEQLKENNQESSPEENQRTRNNRNHRNHLNNRNKNRSQNSKNNNNPNAEKNSENKNSNKRRRRPRNNKNNNRNKSKPTSEN